MKHPKTIGSTGLALACIAAIAVASGRPAAQSTRPAANQKSQKPDAEYTAKIKEYLQDPRISTELVDHLPASDTVPTPLSSSVTCRARRVS